MLEFYWPIFRRTFGILWTATDRYVTVAGIGASVLTFFRPELAWLPWVDLPTFSRWWALLSLLALFAYGFLKALYERFAGLEERLAIVENRRAVKNLLGDCTNRGRGLEAKISPRTIRSDRGEVKIVTYYPEVEEWKSRTHDLIEAVFDKGQVSDLL